MGSTENGRLSLHLGPCDGEILIPESRSTARFEPIRAAEPEPKAEAENASGATAGKEAAGGGTTAAEARPAQPLDLSRPYEQMSVEELQTAILQKLAHNGPVTDQMRRDVAANIWKDSLLNWVRSFR